MRDEGGGLKCLPHMMIFLHSVELHIQKGLYAQY